MIRLCNRNGNCGQRIGYEFLFKALKFEVNLKSVPAEANYLWACSRNTSMLIISMVLLRKNDQATETDCIDRA